MVPLLIDSNQLRPLPKALWGHVCTKCDKQQSRWEFFPKHMDASTRGVPICSVCWLYDSEWAKDKHAAIASMVNEVEAEMASTFQRAQGGRLAFCADADRILGAIAMTSRMFAIQDAAKTRGGR